MKILPKDSKIVLPNRLIQDYMWKEYYPMTVIVSHPPDIRDKNQLQNFERMLREFEELPQCRGKQFTILWLRRYDEYSHEWGDYEFDFDAVEEVTTADVQVTKVIGEEVLQTETGLDYNRLERFLSNPQFKHFSPLVKRSNGSSPPVTAFAFVVVFTNTTTWDAIIELTLKCRSIAASYSHMNVTIWEPNTIFVDQMLGLKFLTLQSVLWTLMCMAIVCAVFIQNPLTVVSAVLAIASISLGTVGGLSWWGVDLDPMSLAAILMTIGMSVDFTSHVSYHYQISHRSALVLGRMTEIPLNTVHERLMNTLSQVAWPMLQGGLSTVICILPVVFLQNYTPLVFVKTITIIVVLGLLHGLVLLPTFFAHIPISWINFRMQKNNSVK